jgi:hypothetical protein
VGLWTLPKARPPTPCHPEAADPSQREGSQRRIYVFWGAKARLPILALAPNTLSFRTALAVRNLPFSADGKQRRRKQGAHQGHCGAPWKGTTSAVPIRSNKAAGFSPWGPHKQQWLRNPGAIHHVVQSTLSNPSIGDAPSEVKLLWEIISAFSPKMKPTLHSGESGPGGIRTRICDLDRVPCCHYTTGPSGVSATAPNMARLSVTMTSRPMPTRESRRHSSTLVILRQRIPRNTKDPNEEPALSCRSPERSRRGSRRDLRICVPRHDCRSWC